MAACAFFGHRNCPDDLRKALFSVIENLIINENVHTFFVGTHGRFDKTAYEVLCSLEEKHSIEIKVVLAYLNQKKNSIYYDLQKTIFPDCISKTPKRFAISKRNHFMLNRVDFIVCFLENPISNTYTYIEKAKKKNIKIINLGSFPLEKI